MKMTFKCFLSLALCAAMLFGMLPMQQVKAEDDYFIGGFIANNTAELVEALTEAERMVAPEKVVTIQIGEPFELTENVSVPGGCRLDVPVPFTIGAGVTMAVFGDLEVTAEMSNKGTLNNNNNVTVYGNAGGSLAFTATGKYTGTGEMMVINSTYEDIIPGMDLSKVNIEQGQGIGGVRWIITPKESVDLGPDEYGNYYFSNMEELKILAQEVYDLWTDAYYTGSEPLVIDEDISIDGMLVINAGESAVTIAEDVMVSAYTINVNVLTVNGTLDVYDINVNGQMDIAGEVILSGFICPAKDVVITGMDKIQYADSSSLIRRFYKIQTMEDLHQAIAAANAVTDSHEEIYLDFQVEDFVIDESVTLPERSNLQVNQPLTIAEGVKLTVNCEVGHIWRPVTVKGELENNGWFAVHYPDSVLTIAEGATYSGDGILVIHGITEGDPLVAIPGLDTTGYELQAWEDGISWQLVPEGYNPGGDMQTFTSFEELKELASQTWEWTWIEYTGDDVLEITENIVLPENLQVQTPGGVRIAEGVNARFNNLTCSWLEVNGDLYVGSINAAENLTVTGTLTVEESIYISSRANLEGRDKIAFTNEWAGIYREFYNVDLDQLKERIAEAEENAHADPRMHYVVYLDEEAIVLEESLTVPSMVNVYFETPLTVAAGATLTLNSDNVQLYAPATIYGTLANNSWLYVSAHNGATMTFAADSTYTGTGTIAVEKEPSVTLEEVLPGLDLSSLYLRQDGDWWWYVSTTNNNGGGDSGELTFKTVEELKELASQTYDNWTSAHYTGSEPLVIDEAIECPDNLSIYAWDSEVRITENGSLTVGDFFCDTLIVEGEITRNWLDVFTKVEVTGTLNVENSLNIKEITELTGRDNIYFLDDWARIDCDYQNVDVARMMELIEAAYASTDPNWVYSIYPDTEGQIVLEQDLTFPSNTTLHLNMPMTVAAGYTLTLNCRGVELYSNLTVEGTLVNNSGITVWYNDRGLLTIAEGGTYSGNGQISIYEESLDNPEPAIPGLDLTDMEVQQDGDWWWYIYPVGGGGMGGDGLTFSTMEQLRELAKETYDVYTEIQYIGEEPLVISEDFAISENVYIWAENADVVIEEGVTADLGQMYVNNLEVKGTVSAVYFYVNGDLTVTGKLNIRSGIGISQISNVTGYQNIVFAESWITLTRVFYATNQDELRTALSAAENPTWPRENTEIQIGNDLTLTENMTVPEDTNVYAYANVTLAENAVLTVNGYWLQAYNMTIEGTLVNNSSVGIQASQWANGHLTIAEGGKYEGRGYLRIFGDKEDPAMAVSGLNLDDFNISNSNGTWIMLYIAGLMPVAAPSDLTWGYAYIDGEKVAMPGAASWKSGLTDSVRNECVWFYRINEDGTEERVNQYGEMSYNAKDTVEGYYSFEQMLLEDLPSGRYYFTVYSAGDYETTSDSETVKSEIWEYTKPNAKLNACTDIGWSEDSFEVTWTNTNADEDVYTYIINWYYKAQEESEEFHLGWTIAQGDDHGGLDDNTLLQIGIGYYSCTVHPISADITAVCNGPVSERSEWYHLEQMPDSPTVQLGNLLLDNTKTDEEKLEEVQQMGAETLKTVIEENANALSIVSQLEEYMAGGTAEVEINDETVEIEVDQVSIIGANLNSKDDEAEEIKLVIDKVEEVREITGNYETSTAVQFSMTLENVKDPKNLEVPVVVTLPVPEGLDPEKIVILHYHEDGTYDVITPEVSIVGGKTYARIVLTSFSDFAILEKLAALLGDVDFSEEVNVDDVLALLWYVLFPDEYPIDGVNVDFDNSGDVNVDDVLTLLWYVLFPDEYPL